MNLLVAVGWPGEASTPSWGLATHVIVAGVSLAVWWLLMFWVGRVRRESRRSPEAWSRE
jgi:hypothetical protein